MPKKRKVKGARNRVRRHQWKRRFQQRDLVGTATAVIELLTALLGLMIAIWSARHGG